MSLLHCFQDSYSDFWVQGLAGVAEETATLNNKEKPYLILGPEREMTQSDSRFHRLFTAVRTAGKEQARVRVEAGDRVCMGAAMLVRHHNYRQLPIQ